MSTSRLFVDMTTMTIDVESKEERKAIHYRIKDYEHGKVVKRFTPNYAKGNYHSTYQLEVSPDEGEPFTLKISYNPLDGHLEGGKRRFLRVEFNPSAVGASRMWILRRVLCR